MFDRLFFFFFQAEDGIRDADVTGVQTCALPISDELGALDAAAVARVREEAWPRPASAEEVHEALSWMGYVTAAEAEPWRDWLLALVEAGRVVREGDRFYAIEAPRDPMPVLRGRLEALGPVF